MKFKLLAAVRRTARQPALILFLRMSTIKVICQSCGSSIQAKESLIGQTRKCPKCSASLLIRPVEIAQNKPKTESQSNDLIKIACKKCGTKLKVSREYLGTSSPCPTCGLPIKIEESQPKPPPPPPSPQQTSKPVVEEPIRIVCQECGVKLKVPAKYIGRTSPCPNCKAVIKVEPLPEAIPEELPPPPIQSAPPPGNAVLPPRIRRLMADAENLKTRLAKSPYIRIQSVQGNPPDTYIIEYRVRGIESVQNGEIKYRDQHTLEIRLTSEYPRSQPQCRLLTPIFHPNIEPAVICIGDHWTAQECLIDLIVRIGEMITYQSYNIKSPLDGNAAMWADKNQAWLPIDNRDLVPPE